MRTFRYLPLLAGTLIALCASKLGSEADVVGSEWPTYGYDYANSRHVSFGQINAHNVHALGLAWKFESGSYGKFESTPIVVRNTMYLTLPPNDTVVALDATNGNVKWRYEPNLNAASLCCGPVNRGVAVDRGNVYVATLDARLIALDELTGTPRWQINVGDPRKGYSETMAPLAWNGMVFVGMSGADIGVRGSLSAYSAADGRLIWRWWSVSSGWEGRFTPSAHRNVVSEKASIQKFRDAWRAGGGSIWMTPALDPVRSTIYVGVGNPSPAVNGDSRPGDNLYTDSVVALDAKTGKMRWYFQEVPHDLWDLDAANPPVLFDAADAGHRVAAVGQVGKTGWFYVLNRDTGALIRRSQPFVSQRDMFKKPTPQGVFAQPAGGGGAAAPVAFDPVSRQVFITTLEQRHFARSTDFYWRISGDSRSGIVAINVDTGTKNWQRWFPSDGPVNGGLNASAGACSVSDVVFASQWGTGRFDAFEAKSGKLLWQFQTTAGYPGSGARLGLPQILHDLLAPLKHKLFREPQPQPDTHIHNSPIAYVINGTEYIAIGGDAFYRSGDSIGDTLYVFALRP